MGILEEHIGSYFRLILPANKFNLGDISSIFSQYEIDSRALYSDLKKETKGFRDGVPIPVHVYIMDIPLKRLNYEYFVKSPSLSFLFSCRSVDLIPDSSGVLHIPGLALFDVIRVYCFLNRVPLRWGAMAVLGYLDYYCRTNSVSDVDISFNV